MSWIKITDKDSLPKKAGYYLLTVKYFGQLLVVKKKWDGNKFLDCMSFGVGLELLAWQPMPEPYEGD